jgi:hypothetical protein
MEKEFKKAVAALDAPDDRSNLKRTGPATARDPDCTKQPKETNPKHSQRRVPPPR